MAPRSYLLKELKRVTLSLVFGKNGTLKDNFIHKCIFKLLP